MKALTSLGALFMTLRWGTMTHPSVVAFTIPTVLRTSRPILRSSSSASSVDTMEEKDSDDIIDVVATDTTVAEKRAALLDLAKELRDQYGLFWNALVLSKAKQDDLMDAVAALEREPMKDDALELLPGDWDLIGTLSYTDKEIPFLEPLQTALSTAVASSASPLVTLSNRFVTVTQRIRCMNNETNEIDRVDHMIQYHPPQQLGDLVVGEANNTTSWWNRININPLSISKSQVILIHQAEVVNATMPPKIRLQLQSIVNNVAGTGGPLDPNGADVLGVNVPQLFPKDNKELYDSLGGAFVTTYVDADLRLSRSDVAGGAQKQLRLFQRQVVPAAVAPSPSEEEEEDEDDVVDAMPVEPPSDVDE